MHIRTALAITLLTCTACWQSILIEDPLEDSTCSSGSVAHAGHGLTWVTLCGGSYEMGAPDGEGIAREHPRHPVDISSFEMLKSEVTVAQFRACLDTGGCYLSDEPSHMSYLAECNWGETNREDHPMNCLLWEESRAFCEWAGGRLPTEAEWEYAARNRGGSNRYPWGDEPPFCDLTVMAESEHVAGCGSDETWPVCSKIAGNTDEGLCDMTGNVAEWVEDITHLNYEGAPSDGSAWITDPLEGLEDFHELRGGSYREYDADLFRITFRWSHVSTGHENGFRCVRSSQFL